MFHKGGDSISESNGAVQVIPPTRATKENRLIWDWKPQDTFLVSSRVTIVESRDDHCLV